MARIFQTMISFDEGGPTLTQVDTIEHQGRLWLVGEWLENRTKGYRIPTRLVCPGMHRFQPNPQPGFGRIDYSISAPVSKAVYEGRAQPSGTDGYEILERPDVRFPLPPIGH